MLLTYRFSAVPGAVGYLLDGHPVEAEPCVPALRYDLDCRCVVCFSRDEGDALVLSDAVPSDEQSRRKESSNEMPTPAADDFQTIGAAYQAMRELRLCAIAGMGQERPADSATLAALQAACVVCNDPARPCVACAKQHGGVPAECHLCFWQTGLPCPPRGA